MRPTEVFQLDWRGHNTQSYVGIILFAAAMLSCRALAMKAWLPFVKTSQSTALRYSNHVSPYKTTMPKNSHITLQKEDIRDKVVVIGDIHGCFDELKALLEKCNYDSKTHTVIYLGDLVNKGPYSKEVVRYVKNMCDRKLGYCVRGNHDDFTLGIALKVLTPRNPNVPEFIKELSNDEIQWLNDLPYTLSIPSLNSIVVHAGLIPNKPLEEQLPGDMHSMRNINETLNEQSEVVLVGSENDSKGKPWVEFWKSPPHVYFGHDAKRGLQLTDYTTGLDTGCVYGRKLTAVVLPEREFVSVDAFRAYEPIKDKSKVSQS